MQILALSFSYAIFFKVLNLWKPRVSYLYMRIMTSAISELLLKAYHIINVVSDRYIGTTNKLLLYLE